MKETFRLSRQTTIDIYLYSEQFEKREVLRDEDVATISNMRYMPVLDFDLRVLAGKKITGGTLAIKMLTEDYPLEVEITTVTHDWDEKSANYYQCREGQGWAGNKWLSDVMMGMGNSVYFREKTQYDEETGILRVNIPAQVLYAMANGRSFGFGLLDCKSRCFGSKPGEGWNVLKKFSVSDKNGFAPVLEVEYSETFAGKPEAVTNFSGMGVENPESLEYASATISWNLKDDNSGEYRFFNIYYCECDQCCSKPDISSMTKLPAYLVPEYSADSKWAGTEVDILKPNTTYCFAVTVSNGASESEPVYTTVRTLGLRELPVVRRTEPVKDSCCNSPLLRGDSFNLYVLDEITKVDPLTGRIQCENEGEAEAMKAEDYTFSLFDGSKVSLVGSPSEKIAFQVLVENKGDGAGEFTASVDCCCKCGAAGKMGIEIGRAWYIKSEETWYPEVVVPLEEGGRFDIPYSDNKVEGQIYQALFVDIDLADNIDAGKYSFSVTVGKGAEKLTVPVELEVVPVKLERSQFILELNGYVCLPECAGLDRSDPDFWKVEEEYYRAAYKHHMSINILPYTHFGTVWEGFAPKIEFVDGVPRVVDWSEWDAHFEKYLDGSYLLETEGKRVPITHMYLPFHENWPMPIDKYFKVKVEKGPDDYPENINEYKIKRTTPYNDFMPEYREGIKAVLKDFIRHIDEKGWKDVQFQYFFNNKHFYKEKGFVDRCRNRKGLELWLTEKTCGNDGLGTSWWLLDEPHFRDDWEAIEYYGSILREAQKEMNSGYNIKFRVDISCYNQLFDFLDGVLDTAIVGARNYNEREDLTRKRKARYGEDYWTYGSWNSIELSNMNSFLWIVETWLKGGSGLVPWYNFALDINYEIFDRCAGLYPGTRFGSKKPMVSLRLKSGRKALEITRYLAAMKKAYGYSDLQMKSYVAAFLRLKSTAVFQHRDDAGFVSYEGKNDYDAIESLKRDIISKLLAKQGK